MRALWTDVIAPVCNKMSACYKFLKSKPHTGMTELDLQHMVMAELNRIRAPEFQADVFGSWGEFAHLSSWLILRNHPRFRGVEAPGAGRTSELSPTANPGAAPPHAGVDARYNQEAGDAANGIRPHATGDGGRGDEDPSVRAGQPRASAMGSKRSKDIAAMITSLASVAKRIKTLTDAPASEVQVL